MKNYLRNTFDNLGVWSRLELATYVPAQVSSGWQQESGSSASDVPLRSMARPF